MRHAVTASKTTGQSEHRTESPSAGRDAVAIAPPSYGIDFVDRASKPLSGAPAARSGAISAIQRAHAHPVLQAKLTVNQPGDVYEQEADRVADQVMKTDSHSAMEVVSGIQRVDESIVRRSEISPFSMSEGRIVEENEYLQTKADQGSIPDISSNVSSQIESVAQQPGMRLPDVTRAFMEKRFGYDFRRVRIHADRPAAQIARSINARAFTKGEDIVFGQNQYAPDSRHGQWLLAHELTHVVQQGTTQNVPRKEATASPTSDAISKVDNQDRTQTVQRVKWDTA